MSDRRMDPDFRNPAERLLRLWRLALEEVPADRGLLALWDGRGRSIVRLGHGLESPGDEELCLAAVRRAVEEGQPRCLSRPPAGRFLREDGREGFAESGGLIIVPLSVPEKAAGALVLGRDPGGRAFVPDDLEFLLSLSRPMVGAVLRSSPRSGNGRPSPAREDDALRAKLIGPSQAARRLRDLIRRVRQSDAAVFISGESGTGKELVARSLHETGRRRGGPFVAVNCGALPDNLLESELFGHARGAFTGAIRDKRGLIQDADGGTFFLDEIGDLPLVLQAKLLRAIQEKEVRRVGENRGHPVSVRYVSATNKDIHEELSHGRFREDLYYRLRVIPVDIPPLRERLEDIAPLADFCLETFCREMGRERAFLSTEAIEVMLAYSWPGNVRELQNEIQRALVFCPRDATFVSVEHLSSTVRRSTAAAPRPGLGYFEARAEFEKSYLSRSLALSGFNRSRTAERIGLSRQGLFKLMRKHGLASASGCPSDTEPARRAASGR